MRGQGLMFFAWVWTITTIFVYIMDGSWIGQESVNMINAITGYNAFNAGGFLPVVTNALSVFTHLWIYFTWDYSFLQGYLGIIRILMTVFTVYATWSIAQEFRYMVMGIFGK